MLVIFVYHIKWKINIQAFIPYFPISMNLEYSAVSPYHFQLKKSYQSKVHLFYLTVIYWFLSMMQSTMQTLRWTIKKKKGWSLPSTELQMNNNTSSTMIHMRNDITTISKITQNLKLPLLFILSGKSLWDCKWKRMTLLKTALLYIFNSELYKCLP